MTARPRISTTELLLWGVVALATLVGSVQALWLHHTDPGPHDQHVFRGFTTEAVPEP